MVSASRVDWLVGPCVDIRFVWMQFDLVSRFVLG